MSQKFDNPEASIRRHMEATLPPAILSLLERAASLAEAHGWELYMEGGFVRDALLQIGRPEHDVDLSVVGDAPELVALLADESRGQVKIHGGFGTATLYHEGMELIDLVTARHETYPTPGALPVVEAGSIQDDLARRDFTINAMAVALSPTGVGTFLDPHGGLGDLAAQVIRWLHPGSFRDDPTRIFRAVKLAKRLGFRIEPITLEGILLAVRDGALYTISMDRITRELLLILEEPQASSILAQLNKLGVLEAIYPGLTWPYPPGHMTPTEEPGLTKEKRRDTYLAILGAEYAAQPEEAETLARWLHLSAPHIRLMRDAALLAQVWPHLGAEGQTPSGIYNLLKPLDFGVLKAFARIGALAADAPAWEHLHRYLDEWRHTKTSLTGDYLQTLGIPKGPIYKRALDALLEAKLDGKVPEKEDEEQFVEDWLEREGVKSGKLDADA